MTAARGDKRPAWINRGWQPTELCFCPSPEAWKRLMREIGITIGEEYPTTGGCCTTFTKLPGPNLIVVTFNRDRFVKHNTVVRVGLIAHESTHVWQNICQLIGIVKPDAETEAYAIQSITQDVMAAIEQCWPEIKWT